MGGRQLRVSGVGSESVRGRGEALGDDRRAFGDLPQGSLGDNSLLRGALERAAVGAPLEMHPRDAAGARFLRLPRGIRPGQDPLAPFGL